MTSDFIKDMAEKAKEGIEPIGKFNSLLTRSVQDTLKMQMEFAKTYSDMASDQFKAFSEIRDMESMQGFFKGQLETMTKFNEQMMSDLQSLSEAAQNFRDEAEEIFNNKASESKAKTPAKTKA